MRMQIGSIDLHTQNATKHDVYGFEISTKFEQLQSHYRHFFYAASLLRRLFAVARNRVDNGCDRDGMGRARR